MRNISLDNITTAVHDSMKDATDARFREVIGSLVTHLHAFAREVHLTHDEWNAGIDFLWRAGRISDDKRNEFVLTSDVLGPVVAGRPAQRLDARHREQRARAVLRRRRADAAGGREHRRRQQRRARADARPACSTLPGQPLAGALLDFWQTDADGLYSQAMPHKPEFNLRCRMHTDAQGRYALQTVKPRYYSVPYDGPVGDLLRAGGRHALRPSHFHVLVTAPGHRPLVTELFADDDPYIDADAVFGVRSTLVAALRAPRRRRGCRAVPGRGAVLRGRRSTSASMPKRLGMSAGLDDGARGRRRAGPASFARRARTRPGATQPVPRCAAARGGRTGAGRPDGDQQPADAHRVRRIAAGQGATARRRCTPATWPR